MDDSSEDEIYACPCGRQFKRKATYERHMDIAHSSSESHKCRVCGKTFGNANTLKMHMNIHQDSKTDARIERLTRGRKNRTPSGSRDKSDRSGERGSRMKSPNAKRDRSKSKELFKQLANKEDKSSTKKLKTGGEPEVTVPTEGLLTVSKSSNMDKADTPSKSGDSLVKSCDTSSVKSVSDSQSVSQSGAVCRKPDLTHSKSADTSDSVRCSALPVVIKTEPPSPEAAVSCEEPSVSPSAKENVLPLVTVAATEPVKNMVLAQEAGTAGKVSLLLEKDKVRLVDSTNTSRMPLPHDPTHPPSTIIIKIEDTDKHCQVSDVPKSCGAPVSHSSQEVLVSSTAHKVAGLQTPLFVQLPEVLQAINQEDMKQEADSAPDTDDEVGVRKSTRLRGKTPGWRSWLEEEEGGPGSRGGVKRQRNRPVSKVKLEGEDYDIIQQVVDMTSGGYVDPEGPELPTTLASPADPGLHGLNKRPRGDVTKTVFACPVCSKEFFSEKYLSMHMSLHRGTAPEVPSPQGTEEEEPPVKKTKLNVNGAGAHWTCKICNKTFAQNSNFKNHIRTHSDERPFVCDICCIGFKERYHLKKHMLFKHSNELKEECRVCGKKFKDSTAVRAHERIHSDVRPYACRRCGKTFKTSECLWHHENRSKTCGVALDGIQAPTSRFRRGRQPRKSPEQSPPVVKTERLTEVPTLTLPPQPNVQQQTPPPAPVQAPSLLAVQTLPSAAAPIPTTVQALEAVTAKPTVQILAQKSSLLHVGTPVVTPTSQLLEPPAQVLLKVTPESPGGPMVSSVADPQLPVVKVEQEHALPDYDLSGLPSDSSLDDSSQDADLHDFFGSDTEDTDDLDSPMSLDDLDPCKDDDPLSPDFDLEDDERLPAMVAGSDLTSLCCDALEIRADSQGKKRYLCTKCGKQFASPAAFEKHMITHSEMRPYKCNVCDIGFKLKVHLKKHNLYRHSNEYPCECSICGKKFKDSSAVRLHERIHSTDRPFKCECGKSFKTRENLWGHRHRGPCDKNKDLILTTKMHKGMLPNMPVDAHAKIGDTHVSAHASILDNQIIAHAMVSNSKITAKATIGDNGEVTASALIHGPKISAQASVSGPEGSAQAKVGGEQPPIPATVVELQAKEEQTVMSRGSTPSQATPTSLPTAVVAPIKKVTVPPPQTSVASPPAKVSALEDKGLPPFETFAPTIMSALQKPPRLPPGVVLPHLAKQQQHQQQTSMSSPRPLLVGSSIADKCPTIQKYLQQNRPTTTKLPGIQQLFQSHSLAHALRQGTSSSNHKIASPSPHLPRPPATPPSAPLTTPSPSPFPDLNLPPPPPYPGNPNMGGPANADFRAKTPSSFENHQSPSAVLPLMCWDEDSGPDKKGVSVQWHTDTETLFHELANSPAFGQL